MELFEAIIQALWAYDVDFEIKEHELAVVNRGNGNVLSVFEEESFSLDRKERYVEFTVEFSTQHRHYDPEDADELLDYMRSILDDRTLPLEFYQDETPRFGGELKSEDLDRLSVSYLTNEYGFIRADLLSLDYEIRSWSGKYDTGRRRVADLNP